jgi:hypothetical protein
VGDIRDGHDIGDRKYDADEEPGYKGLRRLAVHSSMESGIVLLEHPQHRPESVTDTGQPDTTLQ